MDKKKKRGKDREEDDLIYDLDGEQKTEDQEENAEEVDAEDPADEKKPEEENPEEETTEEIDQEEEKETKEEEESAEEEKKEEPEKTDSEKPKKEDPKSEAEGKIGEMVKTFGAEKVLELILGNRNAAIEQIIAEMQAQENLPPLHSGLSADYNCRSIFDLASYA